MSQCILLSISARNNNYFNLNQYKIYFIINDYLKKMCIAILFYIITAIKLYHITFFFYCFVQPTVNMT